MTADKVYRTNNYIIVIDTDGKFYTGNVWDVEVVQLSADTFTYYEDL